MILNENPSDKFVLESVEVEVPELQGKNSQEICKEKCSIATEKVSGPVIVEDTCLCFNALKGLPGPYIKWFLNDLGLDGLISLVAGHEDKSAYALCTICYSEGPGSKIETFEGKTDGTLVPQRSNPKENPFGWDPIFQPLGFNQTYAEMSTEEKNKISHRRKSVELFREFLRKEKEKSNDEDNGSKDDDVSSADDETGEPPNKKKNIDKSDEK